MFCNLTFISVGTGNFAEEFLPFQRGEAMLILLGVVGIYVTLGGFFGVNLTVCKRSSVGEAIVVRLHEAAGIETQG